jgi:hypothetical protein
MKVTREMIEAARRAEYDDHQRNRMLGPGSFIGTPHPIIRTVLAPEAVMGDPRKLALGAPNRRVP